MITTTSNVRKDSEGVVASPARLYKYRSMAGPAAQWTESIVRKNEIFFATRRHFNDPFDCRPRFVTKATATQKQKFLRGVLKSGGYGSAPKLSKMARDLVDHPVYDDALNYAIQQVEDRLDNRTGILCLSKQPDNILMWSHYADSHQGICLGFEGEGGSCPFPAAKPVQYQPRLVVCNPVVASREEMKRLILFTKLDKWSYEEEWRLTSGNGPGAKRFTPQVLKEIILGARISQESEALIRSWLRWRWHPVKLRRAVLRKDEYGITIRRA
jgi:hypothetical protein